MLNQNNLIAPLFVNWEVTNECNHKCMYCYNFWRGNNQENKENICQKKDTKVYNRVVKELIKNKIYKVIVTGGEPLLVFNEIYPYLIRLLKNGVLININSNLTLLTDTMAEKISALKIPMLTSLQSYDEKTTNELTQSPHAFERIINGIKRARKHKIGIAVNMVVSQKNIGHIYKTAELAKKLGASKFSVTKACRPLPCKDFSAFSLTPAQIRYAFDELKHVESKVGIEVDSLISYPICLFDNQEDFDKFGAKRRCGAGKNSITIGIDGAIRPCPHLSMSYGTVFEGLSIAWKKMEPWRNYSYLPEKCKTCMYTLICQGGCKAEVLANTNDIHNPDPYADFSRPPIVNLKNKPFDIKFIDSNDVYIFPNDLFIRKEPFGGLLFRGKSQVFIDQNLYRFIKKNKAKKFDLSDLAKALQVTENEVKKTVLYLLNTGMITKTNVNLKP